MPKKYLAANVAKNLLIDDRLGVESDMQISRSTGISREYLKARREALGIKIKQPGSIDWSAVTERQWALTDLELAAELGVVESTVYRNRSMRNIKKDDRRVRYDWSTVDHLLGTVLDHEIAKILNCSLWTVASRRHRLGIRSFNSSKRNDTLPLSWESIDPLMGTMLDIELAVIAGTAASTISRRRTALGIPALGKTMAATIDWSTVHHLLGKVSDGEIAKTLGCSTDAVSRHRNSLEIPSFSQQRVAPALPLLGKVSDVEISRQFGISPKTARRWRRTLGIAPLQQYTNLDAELHRLFDLNHVEVGKMLNVSNEEARDVRDRIIRIAKTTVSFESVQALPPRFTVITRSGHKLLGRLPCGKFFESPVIPRMPKFVRGTTCIEYRHFDGTKGKCWVRHLDGTEIKNLGRFKTLMALCLERTFLTQVRSTGRAMSVDAESRARTANAIRSRELLLAKKRIRNVAEADDDRALIRSVTEIWDTQRQATGVQGAATYHLKPNLFKALPCEL